MNNRTNKKMAQNKTDLSNKKEIAQKRIDQSNQKKELKIKLINRTNKGLVQNEID